MSSTKIATVVGCNKLSVRKDPDVDVEVENSCVEDSEEIVAEVSRGDSVMVDMSNVRWDWKGRKFYKVWTAAGLVGYVPAEAVQMH